MSERKRINVVRGVAKGVFQHAASMVGGAPEKTVIFVAGVPRSGTNMLMQLLDRSWRTQVFFEGDRRAFKNFAHISDDVLRELTEKSPAPRPVFKSLLDSHRQRTLLDLFALAKVLWAYRSYDDVVASILARWRGTRNYIDEIVEDPAAGKWRASGMTSITLEKIRSLYRSDMTNESANALFWLYRNQLVFDQRLESDPRFMLVKYEDLVRTPERVTRQICAHIDIPYAARLHGHVHPTSAKQRRLNGISPEVRLACDAMQERLEGVRTAFSVPEREQNHGTP